MLVEVRRTIKQTIQVEIKEAVGSMKELREKALELARHEFAYGGVPERLYEGDGKTYKITNMV
tara:strand:- start:788 stop:976 length:189 start_codon:yes stop_codon:yes gene_type:complete